MCILKFGRIFLNVCSLAALPALKDFRLGDASKESQQPWLWASRGWLHRSWPCPVHTALPHPGGQGWLCMAASSKTQLKAHADMSEDLFRVMPWAIVDRLGRQVFKFQPWLP